MSLINKNILNKHTGISSSKGCVFVGVSGGVDSSVALALLKDQGYDVTGVFIKTWHPDFLPCTWQEEKRDAMRVCATLDVPFLLCDAEEEYKKGVADYMIEEYKKGRTPNPDVMCNRYVKFGAFYDFAMSRGADYVATGHYAQIKNGQLYMSADTNKDQTYFLWTLSPEHIAHTLFPIGHLEKKEVRNYAKKYALPTSHKKDSQGICFIGDINMKDFLAHYIQSEKGNVLDEKGKVIGTHDGAVFYTIGERHGFSIFPEYKTAHDEAYYVVTKDISKNTVTVSHTKPSEHADFGLTQLTLESCVVRKASEIGAILSAKVRYRQEPQICRITGIKNDTLKLVFDVPQQVASGQSCVIYKDDLCVGGGIVV